MKQPVPSWISITTTQQDELAAFVPMSGWCLVPKAGIPTLFPAPFRQKFDSALAIAAPTSSGGTYLVFNALRVEPRSREIDQEPFAIIVHSTGPAVSGMFLHHGNWPDRTRRPPAAFWAHVDESGVGDYFLTYPPSALTTGTLDELPPGHREAFDRAISYYRSGLSTG